MSKAGNTQGGKLEKLADLLDSLRLIARIHNLSSFLLLNSWVPGCFLNLYREMLSYTAALKRDTQLWTQAAGSVTVNVEGMTQLDFQIAWP